MNKCIILSVQPQYLHKILTGKKTIEIRKSMPKDCEYPIDVYLYCTKGKPYLYESVEELWWWNDGVLEPFGDNYGVRLSDFELPEKFHNSESRGWNKLLNGFIVAKFTLNKVESFDVPYPAYFYEVKDKLQHIVDGSCLNLMSLHHYLRIKSGYAWHIDNLKFFNKPMELRGFYRNNFDEDEAKPCNCGKHCEYEGYDLQENCSICTIDYDGSACPFLKVQRPPQSWCYAYKEE